MNVPILRGGPRPDLHPPYAYIVESPAMEKLRGGVLVRVGSLKFVTWDRARAQREVDTAPPGYPRELKVVPWKKVRLDARQKWIDDTLPPHLRWIETDEPSIVLR